MVGSYTRGSWRHSAATRRQLGARRMFVQLLFDASASAEQAWHLEIRWNMCQGYKVEDLVKEGDKIWVKCLGVDERGKVRLSRKAANADREAEEADTEEVEA